MGGGGGAAASDVSGNDDDAVFNRVGEINDGAGGGGGVVVNLAGSGGLASGSGGGGGDVSGDGGAAVVNDRNECPSDTDLAIAGGEPDVARGIGDRARGGGLRGGFGAVALAVSGNDDDAVFNRVGETHDGAGGGDGAVSGAGSGGLARGSRGSGGGGVCGDGGTAVVSDRNECPSDNDLLIAVGEHDAARGGGDRARGGGLGGGGGAVALDVSGNDDDAVFNRVGELNDGAGGGGGVVVNLAGSGGLARGSGGGGVSGDGGAAVVSERNECPSDNDSFIAGGERDIARGIGDRARGGGLDGGGGAVVLSVSGNDDDAVYNRVGETSDGAGGGGGVVVNLAGSGFLASGSGSGGVSGDDVTAAVSDRNGCPSDNDLFIAGGEHDAARGGGRSEDREDLEENSCAPTVRKDIGTSACYAKSGMHATTVLCGCPKGVDPGPGRYITLICSECS